MQEYAKADEHYSAAYDLLFQTVGGLIVFANCFAMLFGPWRQALAALREASPSSGGSLWIEHA